MKVRRTHRATLSARLVHDELVEGELLQIKKGTRPLEAIQVDYMCSERMRDHALGRLLRSSLSVTTCGVSRTCDSAPKALERGQDEHTVRQLILDSKAAL